MQPRRRAAPAPQASLAGNTRLAIICCINPASAYVDDSRNTLLFGLAAKNLKLEARVNESTDASRETSQVRRAEGRLGCEEASELIRAAVDAGARAAARARGPAPAAAREGGGGARGGGGGRRQRVATHCSCKNTGGAARRGCPAAPV